MDADGSLAVNNWQPGPPRPLLESSHRQIRYGLSARLLGVLGTLLIHAAILQSLFVLGTSAKKVHLPVITGPGSSAIVGDRTTDQPLVLLQPIAAEVSPTSVIEEFASLGVVPRNPQIALLSSDPSPPAVDITPNAKDDPTAENEIASGDPAGRARLFGIYTRQIQARIDRIWRRPRSPISDSIDPATASDETFRCQVQVAQDVHGNVEEILLPDCNGTFAWQQSLVSAIREASPLPAPPDQKIFSKLITLQFQGYAHRLGNPTDNYEVSSTQPPQSARNQ